MRALEKGVLQTLRITKNPSFLWKKAFLSEVPKKVTLNSKVSQKWLTWSIMIQVSA